MAQHFILPMRHMLLRRSRNPVSYGTLGSSDTERAKYVAEKEKQATQAQPPDDQFQRASRATAEAQQEADAKRLDEVEEGKSAVYMVGGVEVGPNGRPIGKDGKEEPAPPGALS